MNKNNITKFRIKLLFTFLFIFIFFITCSNIYAIDVPNLNCKNAILIDNDSGKVIYENGLNDKVYPASTTKVLTAILALENLDITTSTVATETAVDLPYGSSNAAIKQGEVMKIEDLLYAMMLKSGNDAANVLAEAVSGSIENFVILMNNKLKEIGCNNTNFTNAHGYHDDNHYTTPSDMMKILSYAINNENFVKIFSTSTYTIAPTNKTNTERKYQNTNRLMLTKEDSYLSRFYEYCIGGKTGYTDEAGRTLVAYAKQGDENLILGVFNSNPSGNEDLRYTDAISLFEYGFNNFEKTQLLDKNDYSFSYTDNNKELIYEYSINDDIYALSNIDDMNNPLVVNYDIQLDYTKLNNYDINSQDYKNQVIGSITISFRQNNTTYDKSFDLVLSNITEIPTTVSDILLHITKILIVVIISILILYIILKILFKSKKSKRNENKKTSITRTSNYESNTRRNPNYKPRRSLK